MKTKPDTWEADELAQAIHKLKDIEAYYKARKELYDTVKAYISKDHATLKKRVEKMRKYHTKLNWKCPKCDSYGREGGFCDHDGRKLISKEFTWPEFDEENYNKALDDVLALLGDTE